MAAGAWPGLSSLAEGRFRAARAEAGEEECLRGWRGSGTIFFEAVVSAECCIQAEADGLGGTIASDDLTAGADRVRRALAAHLDQGFRIGAVFYTGLLAELEALPSLCVFADLFLR